MPGRSPTLRPRCVVRTERAPPAAAGPGPERVTGPVTKGRVHVVDDVIKAEEGDSGVA